MIYELLRVQLMLKIDDILSSSLLLRGGLNTMRDSLSTPSTYACRPHVCERSLRHISLHLHALWPHKTCVGKSRESRSLAFACVWASSKRLWNGIFVTFLGVCMHCDIYKKFVWRRPLQCDLALSYVAACLICVYFRAFDAYSCIAACPKCMCFRAFVMCWCTLVCCGQCKICVRSLQCKPSSLVLVRCGLSEMCVFLCCRPGWGLEALQDHGEGRHYVWIRTPVKTITTGEHKISGLPRHFWSLFFQALTLIFDFRFRFSTSRIPDLKLWIRLSDCCWSANLSE